MKLSVLMITKNAKEVIEEALKSLKGLWDELVIIDSGSKDGTLEIAKKFTNNVSSYPFQDNYSDVRNIGLSKVTGNWILVLDADERLSEELKRKISVLINDRNTDGYWFRRKTFISTTPIGSFDYFEIKEVIISKEPYMSSLPFQRGKLKRCRMTFFTTRSTRNIPHLLILVTLCHMCIFMLTIL